MKTLNFKAKKKPNVRNVQFAVDFETDQKWRKLKKRVDLNQMGREFIRDVLANAEKKGLV
jgi:hypothetical protein